MVRLEIAGQLCGHGRFEGAIGGVGVVARVAQYADFILHLHHENGVIAAVDLFDVLHESGEGAGIGLLGGGGRGTQYFHLAAVLHDARKPVRILLDPDGRVARHAVLPRCEPEEDDALMLRHEPGSSRPSTRAKS